MAHGQPHFGIALGQFVSGSAEDGRVGLLRGRIGLGRNFPGVRRSIFAATDSGEGSPAFFYVDCLFAAFVGLDGV